MMNNNLITEKEDDVLYFESMIDTMIASDQALSSMSSPNDKFGPLPNIYPLSPTISLQPEHIYNLQDHYRTLTFFSSPNLF